MASRQLCTLIQHLRRCVCPRGEDTLSDAQLLERWTKQRDEAAFEVLLWRHGAMVLSVCRLDGRRRQGRYRHAGKTQQVPKHAATGAGSGNVFFRKTFASGPFGVVTSFL